MLCMYYNLYVKSIRIMAFLKLEKLCKYLKYVKDNKKDHSHLYRHKNLENAHVIVIIGVRILIEYLSAIVEKII